MQDIALEEMPVQSSQTLHRSHVLGSETMLTNSGDELLKTTSGETNQ